VVEATVNELRPFEREANFFTCTELVPSHRVGGTKRRVEGTENI
jgi:hypothetical protein